MCWNFVSEWLSQLHVMNHFETHGKFIEEKYSALATGNCEILWSTCFRYMYVELISAVCSTVTEDVKKTGIMPSRVHNSYSFLFVLSAPRFSQDDR